MSPTVTTEQVSALFDKPAQLKKLMASVLVPYQLDDSRSHAYTYEEGVYLGYKPCCAMAYELGWVGYVMRHYYACSNHFDLQHVTCPICCEEAKISGDISNWAAQRRNEVFDRRTAYWSPDFKEPLQDWLFSFTDPRFKFRDQAYKQKTFLDLLFHDIKGIASYFGAKGLYIPTGGFERIVMLQDNENKVYEMKKVHSIGGNSLISCRAYSDGFVQYSRIDSDEQLKFVQRVTKRCGLSKEDVIVSHTSALKAAGAALPHARIDIKVKDKNTLDMIRRHYELEFNEELGCLVHYQEMLFVTVANDFDSIMTKEKHGVLVESACSVMASGDIDLREVVEAYPDPRYLIDLIVGSSYFVEKEKALELFFG